MSETDSTGKVFGTPAPVRAAQREAARDEHEDDGTVAVDWDGDTWHVPAEPTIAITRATSRWYKDDTGDPDLMLNILMVILGNEQYARLELDDDSPIEQLGEIVNGILTATGKVWGVGNGNRSSRRSRGTTKR